MEGLHGGGGNGGGCGEDSDDQCDVVTDFLNSNNCNNTDTSTVNYNTTTNNTTPSANIVESQNYCIPVINTYKNTIANQQQKNSPAISIITTTSSSSNNNNSNNNSQMNSTCNNNMIPTINVTPHSPASVTKYNNIFEDTLSQLQNIRESVVQMKNSSAQKYDGLSNFGLLNAAILSTSLPDLNAANGGSNSAGINVVPHIMMWSPQQQQYLLNADRRKSWTAIDDLTAAADCTNKSVSLSSLDSEEQETIRVTEQRRRSARNSTGGISTHSLNEAELVRDFERIVAKRNLATEVISRIPLQKSISTSSIIAKEDIKAIARHLTDSEDENQSLLRAHAKTEVFDNVEKRRKRGSLFFRKKKDKTKMKPVSQMSSCDTCGVTTLSSTLKEHQMECKGKRSSIVSSSFQRAAFNVVKKSSSAGGSAADGNDYYDGPDPGGNYNDDAPLIRSEFLNDPQIEAHDLGAEPCLGIALEEHDSWSPSVPKEVLKSLKEKQIKRQEHIYEFIMTEKHHLQTLLVIQKVFVESLERHFPSLNVYRMFPRLLELTDLHTAFLKRLRQKQRENYIVDSIADILLEFFSLEKAQHLRLAYGEFCANHRTALEQFKSCMTSRDQSFAEWYKHCLTNPLLKKKGIPECILFVTQRLTKYPLLIEPLLKSAREDKLETEKLQHALNLVKGLLVDVDACVAEKELRERQIDIYNRIDTKSFAIYKTKPFKKSDIGVESRRRLKFEGLATLMQGRSKMQVVLVVVLTDCLCFLCENSAHNKYTFFTPENKAGVVSLQKLLIREKAGTESRGIYIISSNPDYPEMYELKVQQPKDKNVWIQSIRQAVLECPSTDVIEAEDLTAEEKLRIGVNKREIIEKMRQKDIEHALLLEEKMMLQHNLLSEHRNFSSATIGSTSTVDANVVENGSSAMSAANFLATYGCSYKDLVTAETDPSELWKRVLSSVQDIGYLASTIYTAATGLPVSRSVSSVGEKQSDHYSSPMLPKRAETFAGFDEKRAKNVPFQCREVAKLATPQLMTPRLQELEEKREPKSSGNSTGGNLVSSAASMLTNVLSTSSLSSMQQEFSNQSSCDRGSDLHSQKDHNYASLQISHHLHTLLCIILQQMTTIQNLQLQLALYRESPRSTYTHNDQLEELRNLQDKLQEEKTAWAKQREQQELDIEDKRAQLSKLQEEVKAEQEDIKQQREQLYRKMELLSNQGLLISPSTPLMLSSPMVLQQNTAASATAEDSKHDSHDTHEAVTANSSNNNPASSQTTNTAVDRRKDKWRTASTISKAPPVNLLSATNAPKIDQTIVKQKLPMKLSSLSSMSSNTNSNSSQHSSSNNASSKIDKSASFNTPTSNAHHNSSSVTQLFPLKLADKRSNAATPSNAQQNAQQAQQQSQQHIVPQHSRTGSSPAVIQHQAAPRSPPHPMANVTRTESSSTFTYGQQRHQHQHQQQHQQHPNTSSATPTSSRIPAQAMKSNMRSSIPTPKTSSTPNTRSATDAKSEEEEIYF